MRLNTKRSSRRMRLSMSTFRSILQMARWSLGQLLIGVDSLRSRLRKQLQPNRKLLDLERYVLWGRTPLTEDLKRKLPEDMLSWCIYLDQEGQRSNGYRTDDLVEKTRSKNQSPSYLSSRITFPGLSAQHLAPNAYRGEEAISGQSGQVMAPFSKAAAGFSCAGDVSLHICHVEQTRHRNSISLSDWASNTHRRCGPCYEPNGRFRWRYSHSKCCRPGVNNC
ncbi:hypothetical protein F5Y06DRAFT_57587 [Hypoxylon sp. FL0890]|nr:hypothetical protein F5Y06DRAFT_57587 [Hypoxylon sp. FL0890]